MLQVARTTETLQEFADAHGLAPAAMIAFGAERTRRRNRAKGTQILVARLPLVNGNQVTEPAYDFGLETTPLNRQGNGYALPGRCPEPGETWYGTFEVAAGISLFEHEPNVFGISGPTCNLSTQLFEDVDVVLLATDEQLPGAKRLGEAMSRIARSVAIARCDRDGDGKRLAIDRRSRFELVVGAAVPLDRSEDSLGNFFLVPDGLNRRPFEAAQEAGQLLRDEGTYFLFGGELHRVDDHVLVRVKTPELCTEIDRLRPVAEVKNVKGQLTTVPCVLSESQARILVDAKEFKHEIPNIRVLSPCPVLVERGGALEVVSSYDEESGIFVTRRSRIPTVDIEAAVSALLDLLCDFSFATEADKSRALAALITPALGVSGLLGGRMPLTLVEADQSQTGKGFFVRLITAVYGTKAETVTQSRKGVGSFEERISTALAKGKVFVTIDNVRGQIDSPFLESCLTEDRVTIRAAYAPSLSFDPRRCVFFLTSNAADLTVDLANRCNIIRLRKQPPGYAFRKWGGRSLEQYVKDEQAYLLGCIFAVVREWYRRGKTTVNVDHDFREWAGILSSIVQDIASLPALDSEHRAIQKQVVNRHMQYARSVALILAREGRFDEPLRAGLILNVIDQAGLLAELDLGELDDAAAFRRASAELGRKLARAFGDESEQDFGDTILRRSTQVDGRNIYSLHRRQTDITVYHCLSEGKADPAKCSRCGSSEFWVRGLETGEWQCVREACFVAAGKRPKSVFDDDSGKVLEPFDCPICGDVAFVSSRTKKICCGRCDDAASQSQGNFQ